MLMCEFTRVALHVGCDYLFNGFITNASKRCLSCLCLPYFRAFVYIREVNLFSNLVTVMGDIWGFSFHRLFSHFIFYVPGILVDLEIKTNLLLYNEIREYSCMAQNTYFNSRAVKIFSLPRKSSLATQLIQMLDIYKTIK